MTISFAGPAASSQSINLNLGKFGVAEQTTMFTGTDVEFRSAQQDGLPPGSFRSMDIDQDPNKGDYVWGTLEYAVEVKDGKATETGSAVKVRPGDVVQFRDTKFAGRRPGGGTYTMSFSHHTALVETVNPDLKVVGVLHQNFAGKKTVTETTLTLTDIQGGWLRFYRPQPR